jgi:formate/nitrite transporter FocA (FNT family)
MGFSFLAEGILRANLPDVSWRPLVTKVGYSVGFLIVILGSQQLFTENTLTPMVPLLAEKTREKLRQALRLWGTVFVANMLGTLLFGLALARLAVVEPGIKRALSDIAGEAMRHDSWTTLLHAVYAGWIIALLVWVLPGAESNKVAVIVVMTWLIAVGGFAHVIAGSSEVLYPAWRGEASWADALAGFVLPSLIGNMVGGSPSLPRSTTRRRRRDPARTRPFEMLNRVQRVVRAIVMSFACDLPNTPFGRRTERDPCVRYGGARRRVLTARAD